MKKVFLIIFFILINYNQANAYDFQKILISCATTNFNSRDTKTKKVDYSEVKPSHFTGIIEILGENKIIGRVTESSETGHLKSPYSGSISETKITMSHKRESSKEKGIIFEINLISGMFEMNYYVNIEGFDDWFHQSTGVCDLKT